MRRPGPRRRGYDRTWQRLRAKVAQVAVRDGLVCWFCLGGFERTQDVHVDHRLPISTHPHLRLDPMNLRPMHHSCHSRHTQGQAPLGYRTDVDATGTPVDPAHPWNQGEVP